jgi:hypothetical protein
MNIPDNKTLAIKEGDVLQGDDGRTYRVCESYPNCIHMIGSDEVERVITSARFKDFKKVNK